MIKLTNKRVHDYIVQKDELVTQGRAISKKIDDIERKTKRLEDQEKRITAKVIPPKEITDRGDALVKEVQALDKELGELVQKINDSKLAAVPSTMRDEHLALLKEKEQLERDRNKIALKVQKVKDRLIPIIQKEVKPLLGDYDDIETAKAVNGEVHIATFNHLEDWKAKFKR